ncbi:MAG: UvrD-helicase domain-containing protein [Elusimicrobia bacterium]|nr:UvrD-helicase domain-containing protein [Elusimicrobiota bacterium]
MTRLAEKRLGDSAARETARFDLEANVIVEAGAGTGKTALLVDRTLLLLLGGKAGKPAQVREIVALTFTEKAAAEIKLRLAESLDAVAVAAGGGPLPEERARYAREILSELEARFGRKPEEAAALARAALRDLDRAEIGTIHSFCSSLLRLYPLEAGLDPAFEVDARASALEELFESEWSLWLDAELGEEAPQPQAWRALLREAPLADLRALALELTNPRVNLEGMHSPELAGTLRGMSSACERLRGSGEKPKAGRILEFLDWMRGVFSAAADAVEGKRIAGVPLCPTVSVPAWPARWPQKGAAEYQRLAAAARRLDPGHEALLRQALSLLRPFVESLRELYGGRGFITFDGLLVSARDLVRRHPRPREELKRRYRAFLIDEFQDTDPLQGELLLFLSEEEGRSAPDWRRSRPAAGKVFVVGDPKQSIYRFRGADMQAFESFTAHLEKHGAKRCALATNFRSKAAIVGAVNKVFEPLMRPEPGLQPAYRPIEASPDAEEEGGAPRVEWLSFEGPEGPLRADEGRAAEADWIASWIAERRGDVPLKHVAIVLRTASALPAYLEALRRRAIPYVVEGERHFYAAQEVVDFLNLLRAIDEPADLVALAALLRSPLGGLADREIYRLARSGALDCRKKGTSAEQVYAELRGLHEAAGKRSVAEVVRLVLEETPFVELACAAYHHQQTASNLLKFGRLALAAGERGATLKEFIAEIEESVKTLREEGESPLADEHLDAVRLLSIHKAKGLEFPIVILPNLAGKPRGGEGEEAVFVRWSDGAVGLRLPKSGVRSAAMAVLSVEEAFREEAEELRVLYVAMTRPKERLILLGGSGRKGSFSNLLETAGTLQRKVLPARSSEHKPARFPGSAALRMPEPKAFARAWEERRRREAQALRTPLFIRPSEAKGLEALAEEERGERPKDAALLGRLCHEVLERWDYGAQKPLGGGTLKGLIEKQARDLCCGEAAAQALEMLERFLRSSAARRIAASEILGREVPFVFAEGASVVRGVMDLVCRDESGVVVYDFKTGRAVPHEAAASQGELYSRAVRGSLGLREARFELILLA